MSHIAYFGKIPTRSDFIKAGDELQLLGAIDHWLAQTMNLLAAHPRWKLHYDAQAPLHFAFVGPRRRHAIAGQLLASRDQSGRRYPFLAMRTLDVAVPDGYVGRCPFVLAPLWARLDQLTRQVLAAAEPGGALQDLAAADVPAGDEGGAAVFQSLTLDETDAALGLCTRHLILALGLLLKPVLDSGQGNVDSSLVLPLPATTALRIPLAAYWLSLIEPFLAGADFELAIFLTPAGAAAQLIIGFCGASPQTLRAIIDTDSGPEQQIRFDELDWVASALGADPGLRQLDSRLAQPRLTLAMARRLFLHTVLGD